jgi:hypothetical protein
MEFNLAWVKQHKGIVAGIVFGAIVLIYLAKRSGGSSDASGGVAGALQSQQAGQLQMAQLNAQLSAQGQQTQAQLEAEQISTSAQTQQAQDQEAGQIALYGLQGHLYEDQLNAESSEQQSLLPLEQQILNEGTPKALSGHPNVQQTLENELALLLTRGSASGSLPSSIGGNSAGTGFALNIPGLGSLGVSGI